MNIIERYKKGLITLEDIREKAYDLDDEYFPEGDNPEWDNENLYALYSHVLFILDVFEEIFPEDIPFIEETLNCKSEDAKEYIKKWDDYWKDKDSKERWEEGVKRGYWKEHV